MKTKTLWIPFNCFSLSLSSRNFGFYCGVVPFAQSGDYTMDVEEISSERIRRYYHDDDDDAGEDGHSE